MKRRVKKRKMGLSLRLGVLTLRTWTWTQAFLNQNPVFQPNQTRLVRPKNLLMTMKTCLKLKLVAHKLFQFPRPRSFLLVLECRRKSLPTCKSLILQALFDSFFQRNKTQLPPLVSILQVIWRLQPLG
jgi:hypothetical protein